MTELDLLIDKKFSRYRQLEIEEGAKIASDLFKSNVEPKYIHGAMDMLKKILQLPVKFAYTNEEAKERAQTIVEKDIKAFEVKFMRGFLE